MQAETQQNLQKEMQKMQQKFKSREDKAKKDHREEMGRVCKSYVWFVRLLVWTLNNFFLSPRPVS